MSTERAARPGHDDDDFDLLNLLNDHDGDDADFEWPDGPVARDELERAVWELEVRSEVEGVGEGWSYCGVSAMYIIEALGGQLVGYAWDENPEQTLIPKEYHDCSEGHDFALVGEERWLVDTWAHWTGMTDRRFFDLHDPEEARIVRGLHGARENWSPQWGYEPIGDERNGQPGAWKVGSVLSGVVDYKELFRVLKKGTNDERSALRVRLAAVDLDCLDEGIADAIDAIISELTEAISDRDESRSPRQA